MNNIKDFKDLNQKIVLLRLDLNVPIKQGIITDETRIDKILSTIQFLLMENSKILIVSLSGLIIALAGLLECSRIELLPCT